MALTLIWLLVFRSVLGNVVPDALYRLVALVWQWTVFTRMKTAFFMVIRLSRQISIRFCVCLSKSNRKFLGASVFTVAIVICGVQIRCNWLLLLLMRP